MAEKPEYQVLARTMRPQRFDEVVGQDKIKTTLKNAFAFNRLGHAYLFCGSHGIGKTTLARIFAKVLNCDAPQKGEPCNECSSCKEITRSCSLDVIEIDGASNRGIDDIRQINETVGFATRDGKYKIYILDEVHMLTKEAFNALLKTLEEPPRHVKFFFATTEAHKIPTTILSRCQCFYLEPHTIQDIAEHLIISARKENGVIDAESAYAIAKRSNGSLRDALVTLDQLLSFSENQISLPKVTQFLGLLPKSHLFNFDLKAAEGQIEAAITLAQMIFASGYNILTFLDMLSEHYRQILYIKIYKGNPPNLKVSEDEWPHYEQSAKCYNYEQCLYIIDLLLEAQYKIKQALSKQIALEHLLIQIARSHHRISIKKVLDQLDSLKSKININALEKDAYTKDLPLNVPAKSPMPTEVISKNNLPEEPQLPPLASVKSDARKPNICYNTIMQFAAVELEGSFKQESK